MTEYTLLLKELEAGHKAILENLDQIQYSTHNYPEAKPKLRALQEILLSHFSKQNVKVLNELVDSFKGDREADKMLEFLKVDLKDMGIKTLIFFDEHRADMVDVKPGRFPQDFFQFAQDLKVRINIEHEYLFPLLERMKS